MQTQKIAAKKAEMKEKEETQQPVVTEEWGFEQAIIGPVGSLGFLQFSNNDRVIAAQKFGGIREDVGEVEITYYGMCAFKITTPKGLEIVIDPWRNAPGFGGYWFLVDFPVTKCDIGLSTHAHGDHDAVHRLDAAMIMERMGGVFELGDVKITGILDKHMCEPQNDLYNAPNAGWELSAEQFTRMLDHTFLKEHTIKLSPKKIKNYKQHVMYFGENIATKIYKWEAPTYEAQNKPLPDPVKAWERFKPKNKERY